MADVKAVYAGEAQLIRWALSGQAGHTITLSINPDSRLHPFDGLPTGKEYGQRMEIVCVLKDDNEQPTDADTVKANSTRHKARKSDDSGPHKGSSESVSTPTATKGEETADSPIKFKERPRSVQAALMCRNNDFQNWLALRYRGPTIEATTALPPEATFEKIADLTLKLALMIDSKTELDKYNDRGAAWDALYTDFSVRGMVR